MTSNSRDFLVFICIALFIYFLRSFIHILDDYEIFLNFWRFTYSNWWKLQGEWEVDKVKDERYDIRICFRKSIYWLNLRNYTIIFTIKYTLVEYVYVNKYNLIVIWIIYNSYLFLRNNYCANFISLNFLTSI